MVTLAAAVDALATYRLARLATTDTITDRLRQELDYAASSSDPGTARWGGFLADMLDCRWCVSVWLGLGVAAARRLAPGPWGWLAEGLAWSAVAGLLSDSGPVEALADVSPVETPAHPWHDDDDGTWHRTER